MKPKITVVIPLFNKESFIERTILSVLDQQYENIELIVIDDASTDGSLAIVKKYNDSINIVSNEENRGLAYSINCGFSRARGDILVWLNADDILLPGAIKRAAEILRKKTTIDILFGDNLFIDEEDNVIGKARFVRFSTLTQFYEGSSISNVSAFLKRGVLDKVGMIDETLEFSVDYEYFLRAGFKGVKFHHDRYFYGAYRVHEDTKSVKEPCAAKRDHELIDKRYKKNTKAQNLIRLYSMLRRAFLYIVQGDIVYVVSGINRRFGYGKYGDV